jgi:carbonic anhydrase/acetyltransferase-like protein (isoleucine patch superfamily)
MALIKKVKGVEPRIGNNVWMADNATLTGDVIVGDDCTIWFGAVLRGDVNPIVVGNRVNIQDGAVLHTLYRRSVVRIGDDVSIGHNAIVHGACIEDKCLIGMGATLLDDVVVGTGCIVAAGALVLAGSVLEPGGVYAGVPARRVKEVTEEQRRDIIERTARDYIMYASWYDK